MTETLHTCPTCQTPNFTARGLKAHKCKGGTRLNHETGVVEIVQPLEIVTESQVSTAELSALATAIDQSIDLVTSHEDAFEEATLEHRLEIGLHVARAMEVFTASVPNPAGKNQHSKEVVSTVDTTSAIPAGFVSWLGKNVPRLKRPTAYRYATAYRALGIPTSEGSPARIKSKLKDLRHHAGKSKLPMPTLAALVKAAPKPSKPEDLTITAPADSKQLRLEDAREAFHVWRAQFEKAVTSGQLDDLDRAGLLEMKEFLAGARDRVAARLK
jgi:hypothetical protein